MDGCLGAGSRLALSRAVGRKKVAILVGGDSTGRQDLMIGGAGGGGDVAKTVCGCTLPFYIFFSTLSSSF